MLTFTKKQLQERFEVSHNTLTDTIKAVGLQTGQRQYSEAEVSLIEQGRHMVTSGMTYEEIAQSFQQKSATVPPSVTQTPPPTAPTDEPSEAEMAQMQAVAAEFTIALEQEIAGQLQPVVDQVVNRVMARVPQMAAQALLAQVQQNRLHQVFQGTRSALHTLNPAHKTIETTAQAALPDTTVQPPAISAPKVKPIMTPPPPSPTHGVRASLDSLSAAYSAPLSEEDEAVAAEFDALDPGQWGTGFV